jgi:hypothetical protein
MSGCTVKMRKGKTASRMITVYIRLNPFNGNISFGKLLDMSFGNEGIDKGLHQVLVLGAQQLDLTELF